MIKAEHKRVRSFALNPRRKRGSQLAIDQVIVKVATAGPTEEVQFRDFGANGMLELIKDRFEPHRARLLHWIGGRGAISDTFCQGGTTFSPISLEPSLLEALRLPASVARAVDDARKLLDEISACFCRYADVGKEQARIITNFVLYSWFQDGLRVAPYLSIIGPYECGKTTILALLHSLCRRAINVSDFTPVALYELPSMVMPTLLIDEFDESGRSSRQRDITRLLRTGTTQGDHAFRARRMFKTFCAKVIASRQVPADAALASRMVTVSLRPSKKSLPPLDTETLEEIAAEFQPRLLGYRLRNYYAVTRYFGTEVPDFTPRMKDLGRALAAPLLGDAELRRELFSALSVHDEEARLNRYSEPEWAVAVALYSESHRGGSHLTVGELASTVNDVLFENGETLALFPRAVGAVVRSLGLRTEQLGSQGRGFRLTKSFRLKVHELARDLGVRRSDILPWITVESGYGGYPCPVCEELGLMVDNNNNPLRCIPPSKRHHGNLFEHI